MDKLNARKTSVALLSVISNTTLVVLKLIIGLAIGSVSVISEAIHSGVDLLAAIIALFAVRTSAKPADEDHPFGHQKMEPGWGIAVMLVSVVANIIVSRKLFKVGSETDSPANLSIG